MRDGETPPIYATSRRRWAVLLSVASIFVTQGLVITAFAPVAIQVARAYGLSSTMTVNLCAMSFSLLSPPSDFLAVYLFSKYRTDNVLRVASFISFIGAMLRFASVSHQSFWPVVLGTFVMASVASIFLNSQIIIANKWFSDSERAMAMAVLNVSTPIGQIASFALTGLAFSGIDEDTMSPEEFNIKVKSATETLIAAQNLPYIVFFVIFQIVIRDKPEVPPSAVAAVKPDDHSYCENFKLLWANKNFMILAFSYAIVYGVYVSIGTAMSNLLNPFGFTPIDISIAGGTCLLAGVVAALIIGCYLDCSAAYRKTHITLSVLTLASTATVVPALAFGNGHLCYIMIPVVLLGISSVSFFPTCLSYGAEQTFPLQPALVNAAMNFLGQISAFVMMAAATYITDVDATKHDEIDSAGSIKER